MNIPVLFNAVAEGLFQNNARSQGLWAFSVSQVFLLVISGYIDAFSHSPHHPLVLIHSPSSWNSEIATEDRLEMNRRMGNENNLEVNLFSPEVSVG